MPRAPLLWPVIRSSVTRCIHKFEAPTYRWSACISEMFCSYYEI
jgi:hypothetical protein